MEMGFRAKIRAMHHGKLALFLLLTIFLPTHQVVMPQRDINAEETVARNFQRLRETANLPPIEREEGTAFSRAACEAAAHGLREKISAEGANYSALILTSANADEPEAIRALALRAWKPDDRLVTGVCFANTPAFASGRYWIAVGVLANASEKSVSELLGGGSNIPNGE